MSIRSMGRRGAVTLTAVSTLVAFVATTAMAFTLWPTDDQSAASTSESSITPGNDEYGEVPGGSEQGYVVVPSPVTPGRPAPSLPHARTQGS